MQNSSLETVIFTRSHPGNLLVETGIKHFFGPKQLSIVTITMLKNGQFWGRCPKEVQIAQILGFIGQNNKLFPIVGHFFSKSHNR